MDLGKRAPVKVLAVNPGSSMLRLAVVDDRNDVLAELAEAASVDEVVPHLLRFVERAPAADVAGVRLVHGGALVRAPTLLDRALRSQLDALVDLAPLHDLAALHVVDALREVRPDLPIVLCVDTAFHATIPAAAATYAIPWEWTERGARKYGFHGLSHRWASRRAAELVGRPIEDLRMVTCHLGSGASLATIARGMSVDTTMGFTPSDGLVMATRAGSVDPGVVTWIQRTAALGPEEVDQLLTHGSGLLALSGTSGDFRVVAAAAHRGDRRAQLAIAVMEHRLVTSIGAMTAAAGGIDVLVFTGGIGERSAGLRRAVAERLAHLGVRLSDANEDLPASDVDVSSSDATVATLVVRAREDLQLAREARSVLKAGDPDPPEDETPGAARSGTSASVRATGFGTGSNEIAR